MTEREHYFVLACRGADGLATTALFRRHTAAAGLDFVVRRTTVRDAAPAPVRVLRNPTHVGPTPDVYCGRGRESSCPRRMLDTLRAGGVDNLDAYGAVIRHEGTAARPEDYGRRISSVW